MIYQQCGSGNNFYANPVMNKYGWASDMDEGMFQNEFRCQTEEI